MKATGEHGGEEEDFRLGVNSGLAHTAATTAVWLPDQIQDCAIKPLIPPLGIALLFAAWTSISGGDFPAAVEPGAVELTAETLPGFFSRPVIQVRPLSRAGYRSTWRPDKRLPP
ncbi:MAG: hypothetical protein ACI80V_000135 [Rhodothermales bacterium]